ncbi:hypothetical protein [Chlorobium phaeobacteroides]|jgi:hypothetical protein|nr:hypothetical protein [Chlorobium phaeobacteroides]
MTVGRRKVPWLPQIRLVKTPATINRYMIALLLLREAFSSQADMAVKRR